MFFLIVEQSLEIWHLLNKVLTNLNFFFSEFLLSLFDSLRLGRCSSNRAIGGTNFSFWLLNNWNILNFSNWNSLNNRCFWFWDSSTWWFYFCLYRFFFLRCWFCIWCTWFINWNFYGDPLLFLSIFFYFDFRFNFRFFLFNRWNYLWNRLCI